MSNLSQFNGGLLKFNKNTSFSFTNTHGQSAAFASDTVAIYVSIRGSDVGGYITIGSNPTANSGDFFVKGYNTGNENNPGGWFGPLGVEAGHKLSAVNTDGSSQTCYIMELKY